MVPDLFDIEGRKARFYGGKNSKEHDIVGIVVGLPIKFKLEEKVQYYTRIYGLYITPKNS